MKVVILAGGAGRRLFEETMMKPKPMVEIGGKPMIWHIMKHYDHYGFNDFLIAAGYKGEVIRQYFFGHTSPDISASVIDGAGQNELPNDIPRNWNIRLVDTGLESYTGTRIKKVSGYIENETFMMTYGDGLSNVNLKDLLAFHHGHGKLATVTAVHPPAHFGYLDLEGNRVANFYEKQIREDEWINGGFFVLEPGVLEYISDRDNTPWEQGPLHQLAQAGELFAYKHTSFWQCMDTLNDKRSMEEIWKSGKPPWKTWK